MRFANVHYYDMLGAADHSLTLRNHPYGFLRSKIGRFFVQDSQRLDKLRPENLEGYHTYTGVRVDL